MMCDMPYILAEALFSTKKYHTDFVKVLSLWFDNNVIESAYLLPEHFLYTPQQQSS